jgi:hypothetical protein
MNPFSIGNLNNFPLNNVNPAFVNVDGSNASSFLVSNKHIPTGPHTLPAPGNNVLSAAGIFPYSQKGGKINKKKINKISRKYKMKGSKKTIKKCVQKIKKRCRSRYARRMSRRSRHSRRSRNSRRHMKGGAFQSPMSIPNYSAGHSQFQNNNGSLSNTYSIGSSLSAGLSALANPPPFQHIAGASVPDNLNHNTLNAHGNIGAGSGFSSRGSF